ncbi:ATP-binding protein [Rhizobium leguminosarum]|uniref:Putative ATPase n=1 Tax=Rhizobium leguminosarum TaxID=384 RepID=A0A7X0DVQ9_RHILE|nr:ATP-binding protein [Rhizobium leguminosarum]MBB6224983.1 putative ATPase [Rhizobium leguminosarum]
MEVQSVSFTRDGQTETVALREPGHKVKRNCFTIINGVNGTGKSAILRIISDAALGLGASRQYKMFTRDIKISISGRISRTIALSGTHNDRFPMNSGIEIRQSSNRFDLLKFYYYGPKQSGNYTSVFKAANTISHSLLSELQNPILPADSLVYLLSYLGFRPHLSLAFQIGNRFKGGTPPDYFQSLRPALESSLADLNAPSKLSDTIHTSIALAENIVRVPEFRDMFRRSKQDITFDLTYGRGGLAIYDEFFNFLLAGAIPGPRTQLLADLIALGVLSTKISLVRNKSGEEIALEDLSSGEWQLLYSLLNLAINVDDNSLILIDEPENSLHPQWQSEYVSLVRELVSHRSGCHVIIATHSPLLAASIMPEDGNLIRLERSHESGDLHAEMEDTAYGWLPEDVLKERFDMGSVRPPELTKATNDALQLLKLSSDPSPALREAATTIKELMRFLPQHDPLLSVLKAVVEIAFKNEAR